MFVQIVSRGYSLHIASVRKEEDKGAGRVFQKGIVDSFNDSR